MGGAVFPPCILTWGQSMVEVMKIMKTFKMFHAGTAMLSAPNPAAGHCWSMPPWKKSYDLDLDSLLKSRDITLTTKVHLVKSMVFPVVIYGCESWTVKKGECRRIDAFELWCWRRLLRVFWTARRSKQSILNEISPEYSLEGLMLKLKLQNFGQLMGRTDSFEKTLMLGKIERREEKGLTEDEMVGWHHRLDGHEFEWTLGDGDGQGGLACCSPWGCKELDVTERLNWLISKYNITMDLLVSWLRVPQ